MNIVTSYLVSVTGLGSIYNAILLYIVYVTCPRMIVLYSRYRVNHGTNMSVVFVYLIVIFVFASNASGICIGRFPTCGVIHTMPSAPEHWRYSLLIFSFAAIQPL